MTALNRRRFLAISASALAIAGQAKGDTLREWSGTGLGAHMTVTLDHPEGEAIAARAFAEVDRLEDVFSLYRENSALSRLNAKGVLEDPPFELLECLSLCRVVHRATGGLFDPTVQPLWRFYAEAISDGRSLGQQDIRKVLTKVGLEQITIDAGVVRLKAGMELTLNGVAQGFVADRVAGILRSEGFGHVLVDAGEISAIGGDWPVSLWSGQRLGSVQLRDQALASSAPLGTAFDSAGKAGHILNPKTGRPAEPRWRLVSVTSQSAALADALSTAAVLMTREEMSAMFVRFPQARLVLAQPAG